MAYSDVGISLDGFTSFGQFLRFLRRRAQMSQRELAIAVGYSEAQISRLEQSQRLPDRSALLALFVPALDIADAPEVVRRLEELAAQARGELPMLRSSALELSLPVPPAEPAPPELVLPNVPNSSPELRAQPTPFLGREAELTQLSALLSNSSVQLVTIVGLGGSGKTRLAFRAVETLDIFFADGIHVVELAPVSTTEFIIPAFVEALKFSLYGGADPRLQLLNYVRDKQLLFVIDNMEHLVTGAELLVDIMRYAPGVKLLVTSRERLNLRGEWVVELAGLQVPPSVASDDIAEYRAVQLFLQSAQRVKSTFSLTDENRSAVAGICRLVDGLPLAIELAATWVRVLTAAEISQEITRTLDFLATNQRDMPIRHRTLRAVFDHSWRLLTDDERAIVQKLSVFRGGFGREAAQRVANAGLLELATLSDKSLLRSMAEGRQDVHELVRQYATERLEQGPHAREARLRHAQYYAELLNEQHEQLDRGNHRSALGVISAEIDNVRAGWQWTLEHEQLAMLQQYQHSLWRFYESWGWVQEGADTYSRPLSKLETTRRAGEWEIVQKVIAQAQACYGWFALRLGKHGESHASLQQAILSRAVHENTHEMALALIFLGHTAYHQSAFREAIWPLEEGLAVCRDVGDHYGMALALQGISLAQQALGEYPDAQRSLQNCLTLARGLNDQHLITVALAHLGKIAQVNEQYEEATRLLSEGMALSQQMGDQWGVSLCLYYLGTAAFLQKQYDTAPGFLVRSLTTFSALGSTWYRLRCLTWLGKTAAALGQYENAWQSFDEVLRNAMEIPMESVALDALSEMALLHAKTGDDERAAELVALVLDHPAIQQTTRTNAEQLLALLEARMEPALLATARNRGKAHTLNSIAAAVTFQLTSPIDN